jgi:branched-chain amino acid transport system ATP-binding protein
VRGKAVLAARDLAGGYGGRPVIMGVNFTLHANEVLCLIGHNGAGKSTLLKCLFGLLPAGAGEILIDDAVVAGVNPVDRVARGLALVPEGRGIFPNLSVHDMMKLAMWATGVPKGERAERLDWVLEILPAIKGFLGRRAGTLSGGQQQMVSIGRALLSRPRILLLDEPSIGLAPKLFQDLLQPIRQLQQREGLSILLVEQNVREALKISDRVLVMKSGALIWEGAPAELDDNRKLMELY